MLLFMLLAFSVLGAQGNDYKSHFEGEAWEDVFAAGGMHIGHGRHKRFVELSDNQKNIPYQACTLPGGSGKGGHCRHLHHCVMEEFKADFTLFMDYLCIIQRTSIGVCCPDSLNQDQIEGLAGDLPASAPIEEANDAILKITKAENRGCGLSTRSAGRMVGARPANPREWPWMASITPEGFEQYCGGVLITDRHVLTAAHCIRRWKADELFVRLGEYDFQRNNDSRSYNFRVVEVRQHEDFDHTNYHNDVAILKLHRPTVFNTYVWPICLPPVGLSAINQSAIIIGWGTQSYGGPHSNVLMEVSVPIWEHSRCVNSFTDSIFEENICAGGYDGGKDACQGDSGGPLMYQLSSGRWAVIGVVSWGIRCGEPNHPGVYARVDKYLRWIVDNARF
ncbi:LOW QUALITY PROTEIN: venom protease-like [Leguminivora glycinivorella]|uniref:LOW QUALITY PROTEIN: venom protease-like n=1 Tax=Leguminivora glycinivorella TaxID=1035111 RepID=UPI00200E1A6C|nr:LOW QUALITY PROTEIN: venom protease-like [Leguminivora glycinivorella]